MKRLGIIFLFSFLTLGVPCLIWAATGDEQGINTYQTIPFFKGEMTTSNYIQALFNLAIGAAAIIVVLRMMIVGTKYVLTESVIKKGDAKKEIGNALLGLVIILASVLLLETINPQLINLNFLKNATSTPIKQSDPIDEIGFKPGSSPYTHLYLKNYCGGDETCIKRNITSLGRSCEHNGGRFAVRDGISEIHMGLDYSSLWNLLFFSGLRIEKTNYYCDRV